MFSIHISEKNGPSRSETFEATEISVGRVQGNDLMLPRGNVSKHHARFVHRDGRFIVTDLKSTNGTYVNGRRIAQATLVREGDTIHIGDFVLRLMAPGSPLTLPPDAAPTPPSGHFWTREAPASEPRSSQSAPSVRPHPSRLGSTRPLRPISHHPTQPPSENAPHPGYARALALLTSRIAEQIDPAELETSTDEAFLNRLSRIVSELLRDLRERGEIPAHIDPAMLARDAHRELLELGPLGSLLEDDSISEIHVMGHERIFALQGSQKVAVEPGFSSETALRRALIRLVRDSGRPLLPGESLVERILPAGIFLQAILTPTALSGDALVLRKPRRPELDLETLVRDGALSRAMATFLGQALALRANLLVVDASGEIGPGLGGVLRKDGSRFVTVCASDMPGMAPEGALSVLLPDTGPEGAKLVRGALKLRPDRLLLSPLSGSIAAELLDGIAAGARGIVAIAYARSLELSLERLAPEIAASRPGLSSHVAREWIGASFDLVLEVAKLRDGRHRVLRLGELAFSKAGSVEVRDAFTFSIERIGESGDVEGSFRATGFIPRFAEEAAVREGSVDLSLFRTTSG